MRRNLELLNNMKSTYFKRHVPPDEPGVYTFRDYKKRPLYIGRATSLKDRLKSYFSNDLIDTRGPRIVDMVTKAKNADWQVTASVLEAVILESVLIKRYQPFYNVDERDDKSSLYVVITDDLWPRVFVVRARDLEQGLKDGSLPYKIIGSFGPFLQSGLIQEALKILRKLFPFKDRKSLDPRHDEFYRSLGRSPDQGDDIARRRYLRTIKYLTLFFEGNQKRLREQLEHDMSGCAKEMQFEEAGRIKRLLYALDHVNDIALIKYNGGKTKKMFRMEAYDIAHLSGTNVVGTMVASVDGDYAKSEYRKFRISKQVNDDIAGLVEVLSRRLNHPEWPYPDLIIVDGGETHLNHAEGVLKARRIAIPVVAVTKDDRHKASKVIGNPALVDELKKEIISLNAECHRFAIAYHRKRRGMPA